MNSMQSFDIAVNDNYCCLMTITTACSPLHDGSTPTDIVCFMPAMDSANMSFIKTHGYRA